MQWSSSTPPSLVICTPTICSKRDSSRLAGGKLPGHDHSYEKRRLSQQSTVVSQHGFKRSSAFSWIQPNASPLSSLKKNRPVTVTLSYQDWEDMLAARIERGIEAGLAGIEKGNYTEITPTSTEERIARFQKRADDSGS